MTAIPAAIKQLTAPGKLHSGSHQVHDWINATRNPVPLIHYASQFYLNRGIIFYLLGRYDKAVIDLGTALRLNWRQEKAALWINKARAYQRACPEQSFATIAI